MQITKSLRWVASSKKDLMAMPGEVQDVFGYALHEAQEGRKHPDAKPLKGFGGAGVLEVVEDIRGMLTAPSIRFASPLRYMSFTASRRNLRRGLPLPSTMSS
jgi:hypothetical protein